MLRSPCTEFVAARDEREVAEPSSGDLRFERPGDDDAANRRRLHRRRRAPAGMREQIGCEQTPSERCSTPPSRRWRKTSARRTARLDGMRVGD